MSTRILAEHAQRLNAIDDAAVLLDKVADRVRRFIDWIRAALAPAALPCLAAYNTHGIDYRTSSRGTLVGACACGFKFAAKSRDALGLAINDHMRFRAQS